MNILDITAIRNCTSCQVCAAACPEEAIVIKLNRNGFYRPYIDEGKCIDCSICTRVCYKFQDVISTENLDNKQNFAAYGKDEDIVAHTTSGGIADILCELLINEGFKCVGVVYDSETDTAKGTIAENREQSLAFRGSKYIQSYSSEALRDVFRRHLNEKIAVFGTPCQIYGIDKYLQIKKKRENFILIDIFCHGCPSINVWKKYIADVKKKTGVNSFDSINFRSKIRGWGGFFVLAGVKGKAIFVSPKANDKFYTMFFSDTILNEACHDCIVRGTVAHSDIRLGDFWGRKYDLNNRGVSIVTIATERGNELFKKIQNKIWCKEHPSEDFIPYQSWGKVYKVNRMLRKKLFDILADEDKTIDDAVKYYWNSLSKQQKIKKTLKAIVLQLPIPIISFAKKIYHKVVKV